MNDVLERIREENDMGYFLVFIRESAWSNGAKLRIISTTIADAMADIRRFLFE
jgi:hypothetical protein